MKLIIAFSLVTIATFGTIASAGAQSAAGVDVGTPRYATFHGNTQVGAAGAAAHTAAVAAARSSGFVETVPFWSSAFAADGSIYPFQMVGTDPSLGSKTTTVKTEIIPLKLVFSNGVVLDGTQKLDKTEDSPIFTKADFTSGHTQYGDAIQRAEFWKYVSNGSKNYHVLLSEPKIYKTVTLNVPAEYGIEGPSRRTGAPLGRVDVNWFDTQLQGLLFSLNLSPKTLPIFLDYNTFLYDGGDPANCCILGYHNALPVTTASGDSKIYTYAFAAYSDPGLFGSLPIEDIHALSHEISEWYNDPFTDNLTPNWTSPLSPQYGCSNILEVGDPLVGIAFDVKGYHPQDETFYSWFARQDPSLGIGGKYTYLGTFTAYAPTC
ncbi:hypothetical protein KTT_28260 [Tengunoibacter tsumagoiensis]|uniref:Uncharacterized protein n=1 Tax=Tengunoibacter tsumagoiensis TaxID=2014871 RepID=A0A402A1E1_9CHLR|nr:hypothetical protein KTT_28260 [Tengunoibacter tsumagoiensis]